jgi:hypothetical protein
VREARRRRGDPVERAERAAIREAAVRAALAQAPAPARAQQAAGLGHAGSEQAAVAPAEKGTAGGNGAAEAAAPAQQSTEPMHAGDGTPEPLLAVSVPTAAGVGAAGSDQDMDSDSPLATMAPRTSAKHAWTPPAAPATVPQEDSAAATAATAEPQALQACECAEDAAEAASGDAEAPGHLEASEVQAETGMPGDMAAAQQADRGHANTGEATVVHAGAREALQSMPSWIDSADEQEHVSLSQQPVYASG